MKQNKNLLSSRLTENRMNDQNIQSKPDSAIQKKCSSRIPRNGRPIRRSRRNSPRQRKKRRRAGIFSICGLFKSDGSKSGRLCGNSGQYENETWKSSYKDY